MRLSLEYIVEKYKDRLYAASFSICGNSEDARDVVQDTFIKYYGSSREFDSEEHIKAWLIRVAVNRSKNIMRSFWRAKRVPWEEYMSELSYSCDEDSELFAAVMEMHAKYRIVLHLYYYEGYAVKEIAGILGVTEGAVKTRLRRGRMLLKEKLKEAWNDEDE